MSQDVLKKLHDAEMATKELQRADRLEWWIWAGLIVIAFAASFYLYWWGSALWTRTF